MPSGWSARDARSIGQTTANPARLRTVTYPLAGVGRTAARLCLVGNDLAGLRINERVGVLVRISLGRPHPQCTCSGLLVPGSDRLNCLIAETDHCRRA